MLVNFVSLSLSFLLIYFYLLFLVYVMRKCLTRHTVSCQLLVGVPPSYKTVSDRRTLIEIKSFYFDKIK